MFSWVSFCVDLKLFMVIRLKVISTMAKKVHTLFTLAERASLSLPYKVRRDLLPKSLMDVEFNRRCDAMYPLVVELQEYFNKTSIFCSAIVDTMRIISFVATKVIDLKLPTKLKSCYYHTFVGGMDPHFPQETITTMTHSTDQLERDDDIFLYCWRNAAKYWNWAYEKKEKQLKLLKGSLGEIYGVKLSGSCEFKYDIVDDYIIKTVVGEDCEDCGNCEDCEDHNLTTCTELFDNKQAASLFMLVSAYANMAEKEDRHEYSQSCRCIICLSLPDADNGRIITEMVVRNYTAELMVPDIQKTAYKDTNVAYLYNMIDSIPHMFSSEMSIFNGKVEDVMEIVTQVANIVRDENLPTELPSWAMCNKRNRIENRYKSVNITPLGVAWIGCFLEWNYSSYSIINQMKLLKTIFCMIYGIEMFGAFKSEYAVDKSIYGGVVRTCKGISGMTGGYHLLGVYGWLFKLVSACVGKTNQHAYSQSCKCIICTYSDDSKLVVERLAS